MANKKISELQELTSPAIDDILAIVDSSENETKKIKVKNLINEEYSTNEVQIGYWRGKPLYRKIVLNNQTSVIGAIGQTKTYKIPHQISNIDKVIKCEMISDISGYNFPFINTNENGFMYTGVVEFDRTNIVLRIINDVWGSLITQYVCYYTKTTD